MILKFAFRNILRNKRRSLLTICMMVAGYILFSMYISLTDGVYGNIINKFIDQRTGHVQIHKKSYLVRPRLTNNIKNYEDLILNLKNDKQVVTFTPRLKSVALAFGEKKHLGVEIVGIDSELESKMTNLTTRITKGEYLNSSNKIIIGKRIHEVLNLNINDKIILISQAADGSIANDIFEIGAIIAPKDESIDDVIIYMHLKQAQEFFSMPDKIHEIAIKLKYDFAKEYAHAISQKITNELVASPWQEVEKDFYRAMEADKKGDMAGQMIFIIVVAIGVLNTVLMSILERTQEFGVLRSLGTRSSTIFRLILTETFYLVLISIMIGSILAYLINTYLSIYGIEFEPFEFGGMRFDKMLGVVNIRGFIFPAITIFLSSMLVTLFPAIKAAKTTPIEAMRSF